MKNLLILGGGTAGTMMSNKLHKVLNASEWQIKIVDKDPLHYYQPGFLFIPFGIYKPSDVVRPKKEFIHRNIEFEIAEVEHIRTRQNCVVLKGGKKLWYDVLVVATGAQTVPEETEGLKGDLWHKEIFDFYTYEGSCLLAEKLKTWTGGKMVINLA